MNIGLDYWHVCSDYPRYFKKLSELVLADEGQVHIISAIGKNRAGTIKAEVDKLGIPYTGVHEVIFKHPKESPALKYNKCMELGIWIFYDDRQDVCDYLSACGLMALKVHRLNIALTDEEAEIK